MTSPVAICFSDSGPRSGGCRTLGGCLLLAFAVSSCGRTLGGVSFGDADTADAHAGDATVPGACEGWLADLSAQNLYDVNRLGLGISQAVAEGSLGAVIHSGEDRLAAFHVEKIWYGPQFLEGFDLWVPLDEVESRGLPDAGSVIIGFRGNAFPTLDERLNAPIWWQKAALFPAASRPSYGPFVGYHPGGTPFVAVVRLVERTTEEARFEVVEALKGVLPEGFTVHWNTSLFPVPFPSPGPTEYLASLSSLTLYADPPFYSGAIVDLREETSESRAVVEEALAAPVVFWDSVATAELAQQYRVGWAFKIAPVVLSTSVMGLADECCTGAGGRYVAQRILESLQGSSSLFQVVTGGHGYYGDERCDEPYLLAVHGLEQSGGFDAGDFACAPPGVLPSDPLHGLTLPSRVVQLAGSAAQRQVVDAWLAAAQAVYRLHPADEPVPPPPLQPPSPFTPGDPRAPWSVPVSPELAILAATHPSLLTVEEVALRPSPPDQPVQPPEYYEVTLATTFSLYRFEHLPLHRVKIAFHCGDPRLLQVGAHWVGALLMDGEPYSYDGTPTELGRAFLIPGLLLPNATYVRTIIEALGQTPLEP